MNWGITSVKDIIELIIGVSGLVAIFIAFYTYSISRYQFSFSVMISCIDRFQEILSKLMAVDGSQNLPVLKQYIDLCNEELFYFKNKYIPNEVIDEWLEGMIFYLPLFLDSSRKNLNLGTISKEIVKQNLLADYPRINYVFTVSRKYDIEIQSEKIELINVLSSRVKHNHYKIG